MKRLAPSHVVARLHQKTPVTKCRKGRPAVEFVGIDLHKKESQICILSKTGELVLEERLTTDRERFMKFFADRGPCRIVVESSTESEWVARCLEEIGCEVVVADPNFAPMYADAQQESENRQA